MIYLFLDLDGPVLDVSERYYSVYREFIEQHKLLLLDKQTFWNAKRKKTSIAELLDQPYDSSLVEYYHLHWKDRIETEASLAQDCLQSEAQQTLKLLSDRYTLILVTLRKQRSLLIEQLKQLSVYNYFEKILSSASDTTPRWKIKQKLITSQFATNDIKGCYFIGDTEADLLAGKALGCQTIAITGGIRDASVLAKCDPDHVVNSLNEFYRKKA